MILAGDIGGTHTRLALFDGAEMRFEKKFLSQQFQNLQTIVKLFLQEAGKTVKTACLGVPGPVRNGICKTTNIPWVVDSLQLSHDLKIDTVKILNDLEANAYGLKMLHREELFLLHQGQENQKGNQVLISAGTGLGEAGLFWDGKEHRPFACEGGHVDFAPRNELECELLLFLQKKFGHVSYERVVSGPGLLLLYQFLIETKRESLRPEVEAQMRLTDPSKVISDWGSKGKDKACTRALDWFLSLYGAEAGNAALKFLSLGGVFIGGGIVPHLKEKMKSGNFLNSFFDKGRFRELLETIPVWVILNDDAALLGAAYFAESLK